MSEARFTPGPWEVSHAGEGTPSGGFRITEYYVRLPDADFGIASDIVGADMKPSEANARLIAAAPMLLEALKLARDYIAAELAHRQVAYEGYPHKWATEMEDLASVDAAIAAATGENRHE